MFKAVLQQIRQWLISIWHSLKKESPVVMIIDGKPLYESDPRAQRILRRIYASKKHVVPTKTKALERSTGLLL
jgi:hypothetical protein